MKNTTKTNNLTTLSLKVGINRVLVRFFISLPQKNIVLRNVHVYTTQNIPSDALLLMDKSFVHIYLDPSFIEECSPHSMAKRVLDFKMSNRMGLPIEIIDLSVGKSLQIEPWLDMHRTYGGT